MSDRAQTFSSAFLGLTFECARCHDHKFDPITQRDYYSLGAFFNSIDECGTYNDAEHVPTPSILLPTYEQETAMTATAQEVGVKNKQLAQAISNAERAFQAWLQGSNLDVEIPGLVSHLTLDAFVDTNRFADEMSSSNKSEVVGGGVLAPGRMGHALKLTGDDAVTLTNLPVRFEAWSQYSVVFWLRAPAGLSNGVVFHSTDGTDSGFHGTELSLQNGHLFFVIKRKKFWPGNAIVPCGKTTREISREKWIQIAATYDGSARAEGLKIFIDGERAPCGILRDDLYKNPENGSKFSFGARFRSAGMKDALLDDTRIYNRPLAEVEIAQLYDGHSLLDAAKSTNAGALRAFYMAEVSESVAKARSNREAAGQSVL